jgi:hypothetical protein
VGVIPWLLTGWKVREPVPYWAPLRVLGAMLLAAGLLVLVQAFVRFAVEGFGTPAPVAAPERLVVGGVHRYLRNPMYVAILVAVVGQALLLGQLALLLYPAAIWLIAATFVRWYEENPPSPAGSARTTKPTGARCPPGGPAFVPGNPAGAKNHGHGRRACRRRLRERHGISQDATGELRLSP